MALRVELKEGERVVIGDCVLTNTSSGRVQFMLDGPAPVLREKDYMTPEEANTAAKRIYLSVQTMYLSKNPSDHHPAYFQIVQSLMAAAPSTMPLIEAINDKIMAGQMYKALKDARALIDYETSLIERATQAAAPR